MSRRGFPASRRRVEVPNSPLLDLYPGRKSRFCAILGRLFRSRARFGGVAAHFWAGRCCPGNCSMPPRLETWARIGGFAGQRPFRNPHLGAKKGLIMFLAPHRCEAISWDLRLSVGRSAGLRRQIAQVQ